MKKSKKPLYPGIDQVEQIKGTTTVKGTTTAEFKPDFMPGTVIPNYEKFKGIAPDQVLRALNID